MEELVKHGVDWKDNDDWGWTLLHEVIATGNVEAIRWVSSRSRGITNVCDKLGRHVVHENTLDGSSMIRFPLCNS